MNIAQLVKKCDMDAFDATIPCDVVFGTVVEEDPVKIKVGQLVLEEDIVTILEHLKYKETRVIFSMTERTIVINEGLKNGDMLALIRKCGGENYIAVGKI